MQLSRALVLAQLLIAAPLIAEGNKGNGCQAQVSSVCKDAKGEQRSECINKNMGSFTENCRAQFEKKAAKSRGGKGNKEKKAANAGDKQVNADGDKQAKPEGAKQHRKQKEGNKS